MTMESYPCPKCRKYRLSYEGMLVWRTGEPRPPRRAASKRGKPPRRLASKQEWLSTSPRADYERHSLYRCNNCRAEFSHNMGKRSIHLYEEGVSGIYIYDGVAKSWQFKSFAQAVQSLRRLSKAIHGPKVQTPKAQHGQKREAGRKAGGRLRETQLVVLLIGSFVVIIAGLAAHILRLRGAMAGGFILGLSGVLFGTWLGLEYGRDWGRVPTPIAVLAFWVIFGLPGFIIGGVIGGVIGAVLGVLL